LSFFSPWCTSIVWWTFGWQSSLISPNPIARQILLWLFLVAISHTANFWKVTIYRMNSLHSLFGLNNSILIVNYSSQLITTSSITSSTLFLFIWLATSIPLFVFIWLYYGDFTVLAVFVLFLPFVYFHHLIEFFMASMHPWFHQIPLSFSYGDFL
jgi:Flp pilus assembly protein protease CpaA